MLSSFFASRFCTVHATVMSSSHVRFQSLALSPVHRAAPLVCLLVKPAASSRGVMRQVFETTRQTGLSFIFNGSNQKSTLFQQVKAETKFLGKPPKEFGAISLHILYALLILLLLTLLIGFSWLHYMDHQFYSSELLFSAPSVKVIFLHFD